MWFYSLPQKCLAFRKTFDFGRKLSHFKHVWTSRSDILSSKYETFMKKNSQKGKQKQRENKNKCLKYILFIGMRISEQGLKLVNKLKVKYFTQLFLDVLRFRVLIVVKLVISIHTVLVTKLHTSSEQAVAIFYEVDIGSSGSLLPLNIFCPKTLS